MSASSVAVVPNQFATTEASGGNFIPWGISGSETPRIRYQQWYLKSHLRAGLITEIRYRQDHRTDCNPPCYASGGLRRRRFGNVTLRLSHLDRGLVAAYEDNVGADATIVFSGDLVFETDGPAVEPRPFDYVIRLQKPFRYDPSRGNLVLDLTMDAGERLAGDSVYVDHDYQYRDVLQRNYGSASNAKGTTTSIGGNVTAFVFDDLPAASEQGPILFVHGFCSNGQVWSSFMKNLAQLDGAYSRDALPNPELVHLYWDGSRVRRKADGSESLPRSPVYTITFWNQGFVDTKVNDLDIWFEAYQLREVITKIREVTGAKKVDVIAHSMGGLVTRSYLAGLAVNQGSQGTFHPYQGDIRRVVTIDTPHSGAGPWTALLGCFAEGSVQHAQMLPGSDFFDAPAFGINQRDLPADVPILSVVTGSTLKPEIVDNDGVVSVQSQNLATVSRFTCQPNVYTARRDVPPEERWGNDLLLHMAVHALPATAQIVAAWLGNTSLPPAQCIQLSSVPIVVSVPPPPAATSPTSLAITFHESAGTHSAAACVATIVVRSAAGAELKRFTVDAEGSHSVDLGVVAADVQVEISASCAVNANLAFMSSLLNTQPCAPAADTLCLNGGRFEVRVNWRAFDGSEGSGRARPLTTDTGSFWFFDEKNLELMVKVLDGRAINASFWVFYGALSSVEYSIFVRDVETGRIRTYFNPANELASRGDTAAFPASSGGTAFDHDQMAVTTASTPPGIASASEGPCVPETETLCLSANRFRVTATWTDFAGRSGTAKAVALTPDTGYFWFFSSGNAELMVKALDGRAINGRYWIFYGALSSVSYEITVTDLVTGSVRRYRNAAGTLASAGDTAAFEAAPVTEVELKIVTGADGTEDPITVRVGNAEGQWFTQTFDRAGDLRPNATDIYRFSVPASFCQLTGFTISKPSRLPDDSWCMKELFLTIAGTGVYFDRVASDHCPYSGDRTYGGGWDGTAEYQRRCR
jgi:pimeloyl-ACP methyl ester carboxylesterase